MEAGDWGTASVVDQRGVLSRTAEQDGAFQVGDGNASAMQVNRKLFIGDARKLILSILAYEHGLNTDEVSELAKSGELDLPEGIRSLFEPCGS